MRRHAFDVERFSIFVEAGEGNAFDEFVAMIDVENDHAVAAIFEVITNPWRGSIKKVPRGNVRRFGGLQSLARPRRSGC